MQGVICAGDVGGVLSLNFFRVTSIAILIDICWGGLQIRNN